MPAAEHDRRELQLAEPRGEVPAVESAGDRPFVRAPHRFVDVLAALGAPPADLDAVGAAVDVAGLEVVLASAELVVESLRLGRPLRRGRERRAQDQALERLLPCERVLEREHPAPRRAEQVHAIEPEVRAQRVELVEEDGDAPVDLLRRLRPPAPELVVEHHGPLVGEPLESREVVVRRPGPAVEREERDPALADPAKPGAVPAKVDVSLLGYHPATCPLSSVGRAPPW